MQNKYEDETNHWLAIKYLKHEWLSSWKTRIIKCFINEMFFFDNNNITSRVEDDHFKLKRASETSIEDLKKMITVINLLLKDQRSAYIVTHKEFKSRLTRNCTINIF
jgi:hypothetical protein